MLVELITPDNLDKVLASVVTLILGIGGWGVWSGRKAQRATPPSPPETTAADVLDAVRRHDESITRQLDEIERRDQYVRDILIKLDDRRRD